MANRWPDNSSVKKLRKGTKSNGRQSITRINIRTSCRRAKKIQHGLQTIDMRLGDQYILRPR